MLISKADLISYLSGEGLSNHKSYPTYLINTSVFIFHGYSVPKTKTRTPGIPHGRYVITALLIPYLCAVSEPARLGEGVFLLGY